MATIKEKLKIIQPQNKLFSTDSVIKISMHVVEEATEVPEPKKFVDKDAAIKETGVMDPVFYSDKMDEE